MNNKNLFEQKIIRFSRVISVYLQFLFEIIQIIPNFCFGDFSSILGMQTTKKAREFINVSSTFYITII